MDSHTLYQNCRSRDQKIQAAAYSHLWAYLVRVAAYMTRQQPDGDALAQDCAQRALIRIHERSDSCREPAAFRTWCRQIVSNLVIDELRRQRRFEPLDAGVTPYPAANLPPEKGLTAVALRDLLNQAPISDRSRRVVIGRYLDDLPDEQLALVESKLSTSLVRPSHVQVTRAKNIAKLRAWPQLINFLEEAV